MTLYGNSPYDSTKLIHPTGQYIYPFAFTLPAVLPSSIEARHGYIRYKLKGIN